LNYPLFVYMENGKEIRSFSYPLKGQRVKTIEENTLLKKAFNLMPGTKLNWTVSNSGKKDSVSWEVFTNPYNNSYIQCNSTRSKAWFRYTGVHFCFTHFEGDRDSLLYSFYLAAFRIPLAVTDNNTSVDTLPVNHTFGGWRLFLHDFTSPFFMYLKANFEVEMKLSGSEFDPDRIVYSSRLTGISYKRKVWTKNFKLEVNNDNSLSFENHQSEIKAICESY
jgi:hypothetical protein